LAKGARDEEQVHRGNQQHVQTTIISVSDIGARISFSAILLPNNEGGDQFFILKLPLPQFIFLLNIECHGKRTIEKIASTDK
jgi:hypothetical protein